MFADVELVVGSQRLPSVPKAALVPRDGQSRLFVVNDRRLEERVVALGPALGKRISVVDGVNLDERVVVSDPSRLAASSMLADNSMPRVVSAGSSRVSDAPLPVSRATVTSTSNGMSPGCGCVSNVWLRSSR